MADVTIYTLAKELNMTPSMVSRAFNPDCKVSEEKRQKVLEAAKKYGFSPNRMASRLSMKKVKIGILINSRFKINTDKMLSGIEKAYKDLKDYKVDYRITVLNSLETKECDVKAVLEEYSCFDGVIVTGLSSVRYTEILHSFCEKNKNLVQVQSINNSIPHLFASKHDEKKASDMACEFLRKCLRKCGKNVVLFIGDNENSLHMSAASAFEESCKINGLNLLETAETGDTPETLLKAVKSVFEKHKGKIDGAYITSGISGELCRYIEENGEDIVLVSFDTHSEIRKYLEKGIISATISQNVEKQMESAFEKLVKFIITGKKCDDVIYTDVHIALKSNICQFD